MVDITQTQRIAARIIVNGRQYEIGDPISWDDAGVAPNLRQWLVDEGFIQFPAAPEPAPEPEPAMAAELAATPEPAPEPAPEPEPAMAAELAATPEPAPEPAPRSRRASRVPPQA